MMAGKESSDMVRHDGTYETVPLAKDSIAVAVVQTRVTGVDGDNPAPGIKANLDYMLGCIDAAQGYGGRCDLLCFHEFPLQGWRGYDRKQNLRVCLEVPGAETEAIGAKAKQYGCYISFGCYARDPDWPDHVLHYMVLVGPDGDVLAKHWKQRNVRGIFPGAEQFTTTVYDVYDRFVDMYGVDAVIPIARTPIGNIGLSAVQFEPELFRCMALKGAEIICRVATGGFEFEDMRLTSYHNSLYTTVTNNSVNTGSSNTGFFEETASTNGRVGRSAIFGPRGVILNEAGVFETKRRADIPIAAFREKHKIPDVHMTLYQPVFQAYRERYDPGLYLKGLPETRQDAAKVLKDNARWMSYW